MADFTCLHCGKVFQMAPSKAKEGKGKYCSRKCYGDSRRLQDECQCVMCGKSYRRCPALMGKYCSLACSSLARKQQITRQCEVCGKAFEVRPNVIQRSGGRFCSNKCRGISNVSKVDRKCEYCGEGFQVPKCVLRKSATKYCSRRCASSALSGGHSHLWRGGGKYYRGPNWSEQRSLVRQRDGDICQLCHRKQHKGEKLFAVHHIKRFRDFNGDYLSANLLSNLITLCPGCHSKADYGKVFIPIPLL